MDRHPQFDSRETRKGYCSLAPRCGACYDQDCFWKAEITNSPDYRMRRKRFIYDYNLSVYVRMIVVSIILE
jgi:hypothetical protein